ncbi:MAG: hypothetical protein PF503_13855 [Desulfobacula sp.]|jgi:hypothetical protein|nr:hypothetical protein [Desulfobacula sp.]
MAYINKMTRMIFLICLLLPVLSFAEDKVELLPIEPIPQESFVKPYKNNPKRPGYNRRGLIDRVSGNEIIINDALRLMNFSTQVFTSSDNLASKKILKSGQWVEFILDEENQILKIKVQNR